jgi:hypothetical protein
MSTTWLGSAIGVMGFLGEDAPPIVAFAYFMFAPGTWFTLTARSA